MELKIIVSNYIFEDFVAGKRTALLTEVPYSVGYEEGDIITLYPTHLGASLKMLVTFVEEINEFEELLHLKEL